MLKEDYLAFDTDTNCSKTFIVPKDKIFVMGDNRENSSDSRFWQEPYINTSDVIGKMLFSTPPFFARIYNRNKFNIKANNLLSEEITDDNGNILKPSSTKYPLHLGEMGYYVLAEGDFFENASICADAVYTGTEAERLILTYNGRKVFPAPGTEFMVVEYSSTVDPRKVYIDCKLLDIDGKKLNYSGTTYPSKCYDMYERIIKKEGIYSKIYAYYEVPVGIESYLLKFGSYNAEKELGTSITANYIVNASDFTE